MKKQSIKQGKQLSIGQQIEALAFQAGKAFRSRKATRPFIDEILCLVDENMRLFQNLKGLSEFEAYQLGAFIEEREVENSEQAVMLISLSAMLYWHFLKAGNVAECRELQSHIRHLSWVVYCSMCHGLDEVAA